MWMVGGFVRAVVLMTALLVIASVVYAFQRFENETAYRRGMGFLSRVVSMYDNIFDMHEKDAVAFQAWLRALVLFDGALFAVLIPFLRMFHDECSCIEWKRYLPPPQCVG